MERKDLSVLFNLENRTKTKYLKVGNLELSWPISHQTVLWILILYQSYRQYSWLFHLVACPMLTLFQCDAGITCRLGIHLQDQTFFIHVIADTSMEFRGLRLKGVAHCHYCSNESITQQTWTADDTTSTAPPITWNTEQDLRQILPHVLSFLLPGVWPALMLHII